MKRVGFVVAVAAIGLVVVAVLLWPEARVGPEPINHGRDMCAHCGMQITERGFAGEMRDAEGELTRYDDPGCLLSAVVRKQVDVSQVWIEDNADAGLIPLRMARLVRATGARTPMGYGIIAFRDPAAARKFAEAHRGALIALDELLRNPSSWNRGVEAPLGAGEGGPPG